MLLPQPLCLVHKGSLVGLTELFPHLAQSFTELGVVQVGVSFCQLPPGRLMGSDSKISRLISWLVLFVHHQSVGLIMRPNKGEMQLFSDY